MQSQNGKTPSINTDGSPPFGFRLAADGVSLEEEPTEQRMLGLVNNLHQGGLSYRAIGRHLKSAMVTAAARKRLGPDLCAAIDQVRNQGRTYSLEL